MSCIEMLLEAVFFKPPNALSQVGQNQQIADALMQTL